MNTSDSVIFLSHILPQEGLRCATLFKGKRVSNHFFTSNAELASFILQQDAIGYTVYHACASYNKQRRQQVDVAWIKCLWLDIDCGPDAVQKKTGYANAATAVRELADFCKRASLPPPTVVSSGSGLHVYWVFNEAITLEQWQPYANGLKEKCKELDFHCDPVRTADAASILRTPGTHNRKYERTVEVLACLIR